MLRKCWSYVIEKVDGEYHFVTNFKWYDDEIERKVLNCFGEQFIETFFEHHHSWIEEENPITEAFDMPVSYRYSEDWNQEIYRFQKHQLGGYSAFV